MIKLKYLSKEKIINKRVLLRCDFNVPIKNNIITDVSKIEKSLKTIKYLLNNNNKVIILSHFGRVKCEEDKKNNSLKIVFNYLKKQLDIDFIPEVENIEKYLNSNKNCYLIENTRFTDLPNKKESINDLKLAKYWSNYADVFVIDAFASLHRLHSSTGGIAKFLPTYIGFLIEEELNKLNVLIKNIKRPFIVIMGGAKPDDKIQIINELITKCDNLIITGGILNTFLKVQNYNIGKSLSSDNKDVLINVKNLLIKYSNKIKYTNNFVVLNNNKISNKKIDDLNKEDIILDNILDLEDIISSSKTIFFNGTCGKYEIEEFSKGTKELLNTLSNTKSLVVVGGGDSVSAVKELSNPNNFYFLSSGGGATLEYVATGKLKVLEYIKNNEKSQ